MKTRIELSHEELKGLILGHFGTQLSREKPLRVEVLHTFYQEGLIADITDDPPPLAETDPVPLIDPAPSYSGDGQGSVFDGGAVDAAPPAYEGPAGAAYVAEAAARAEVVDAVFDDDNDIPF